MLAVHNHIGNVFDSTGARDFIEHFVEKVKNACPTVKIELRMDSALFSEQIIECLDKLGVHNSISVAFECYPTTIRCYIEERKRWRRLRKGAKFFERKVAMDSWSIAAHRFLCVRNQQNQQCQGVIQLDLFRPDDFNYRNKIIVANKITQSRYMSEYHEGRGMWKGVVHRTKNRSSNESCTV